MGENSSIEWTDHTLNFWVGCRKPSREGNAMPHLMAFTQTWPQFVDGSKRVTRRSRKGKGGLWLPGWPTLKPGDMIEGIEWMPRWAPHGQRWVCRRCDWRGDTDPSETKIVRIMRWKAHEKASPDCHLTSPSLEWRAPKRLPGTKGHRRIVSVREEILGDVTPEDIVLEGFPDWSTEWFIYMYCVGTAPKYDKARPVNRIEFEELS